MDTKGAAQPADTGMPHHKGNYKVRLFHYLYKKFRKHFLRNICGIIILLFYQRFYQAME